MKQKLPLTQARLLAEKIRALLLPGCERCEIAGSIRREKSEIGDIEIVAISKYAPTLFADVQGQSLLDSILAAAVEDGRLVPGDKAGDKYKKFTIPAAGGLQLDLFITDADCWPVIFAIRTGPAEFSQKLVTQRNRGGLLPSHLKIAGGRVLNSNEPVKLDTEADFLNLCDCGWIEPAQRNAPTNRPKVEKQNTALSNVD